MASLVAFIKARISASIVETVTIDYLFARQAIGVPKRVITQPCDDFLSSESLAKEASV